jgi:hypothetical protein
VAQRRPPAAPHGPPRLILPLPVGPRGSYKPAVILARLLLIALLLAGLPAPARADDISAAGRSVVRVVVIAFEDGEIVDFGHGSGFAVGRNRIITNAHVVQLAGQYPEGTAIGIVPSEGSQSYGARIVSVDPRLDLALLEMEQGSVPPIPLYVGPIADGSAVAALGYPGNVDLATARSANDYITPMPPIRSTGIFSNLRAIGGVNTLLHTAAIARGHSGGPLLDQCGRVLGVNTLITRNQEGDAPFYFAVSNQDLAGFLRRAGQAFSAIGSECVPIADRLREDEARLAAEAAAARDAAEAERRQREAAYAAALAEIEETRENRLGLAAMLMVLSLVGFGGVGIMLLKDRQRPALAAGGAGLVLLAGAAIVFFTRPGRDDAEAMVEQQSAAAPEPAEAQAAGQRLEGRNLCRLVLDRSRVTVSAAEDVEMEWRGDGCVNGRTQYADETGGGESWSRILVPNEEQAVTIAEFRPAGGEYVVTRYLLDAATMERARAARRAIEVKACTADPAERTTLAERQREIRALLPRLPNERLVYSCARAPAGQG